MTNVCVSPAAAARLARQVLAVGFDAVERAIEPAVFETLRAEARAQKATASHASRAAAPVYSARIGQLGEKAMAFLRDPALTRLVSNAVGMSVDINLSKSCFTYYGGGDCLGPHLDQPSDECAVTLIVYLEVEAAPETDRSTGPVLHVFGPGMPDDDRPIATIPSAVGTVVIGRGSEVWHERPRLSRGETVTALTACFR